MIKPQFGRYISNLMYINLIKANSKKSESLSELTFLSKFRKLIFFPLSVFEPIPKHCLIYYYRQYYNSYSGIILVLG